MLLPALLTTLIVLAPAPAPSTVEELDLVTLVERADLILSGRVLATRGVERSSGRIGTRVELAVAHTWLGRRATRRAVTVVGGQLQDGRALIVPGAPSFAVGERVVLFLSPAAPDGLRTPIGLGQGKYRLGSDDEGRRTVARDLSGLTLVDPANGRSRPGGPEAARPARGFTRALRAAVRARLAREKRDERDEK